ncbi:methyltransferase domain-containing protein [Candidatus Saccharibacteria bacterium]|nr:methyltransferase domain-containing protein [Candidatus Saccharibacteria bacterium]
MKYLAVLGRQPEISIAELEALGLECIQIPSSGRVRPAHRHGRTALSLALPRSEMPAEDILNSHLINRLGGTLKLAVEIPGQPLDYLRNLPEGKITLGVSDYSDRASRKSATMEALKFKKILVRHGRSVRVVENKDATLSTATSLHNGLSGKNPKKVELIKTDKGWYRVIGVQDIDAYARRDQARPARDAKVGMLPPKLAQILINLCGPLPDGARILDPFCGTGVVLQEALLMGYRAYGTDISERMVEYSEKNLRWLIGETEEDPFSVSQGDATSFTWTQPIDAVACEGYLGRPMSQIPPEIKLKTEKQECGGIMLGFLKNLFGQIKSGTPVVVAMPAWLREDGHYSRLEILDEIEELGYNVNNKSREGLIYAREGQIVARDIIILRKN